MKSEPFNPAVSAEEPGTPPLIEMKEVEVSSVRVETEAAIGGVNWRINQGDYWVVGALPGGGKSALLLTACGIQKLRGGELHLFGKNPAGMREPDLLRERRRMSLVFEGGGRLFAAQTVAENVALPYCYHHNCPIEEAEERLQQILELMELAPYAQRLPRRVPRALCPRIGLGRALITDPEVVLFDNPLHGLSAREQIWWLAMLDRLREGLPMLSHRPLTIVVTADELRSWRGRGEQFALIKEGGWQVVGGRNALEATTESLLHELLATTGRSV